MHAIMLVHLTTQFFTKYLERQFEAIFLIDKRKKIAVKYNCYRRNHVEQA